MVFLTHEEFALLHSCVGEHWQPLVEFLAPASQADTTYEAVGERDV